MRKRRSTHINGRLAKVTDLPADEDVRRELAAHLQMKVDALVARGWSEEDARQEAERQSADLAGSESACRETAERFERRGRRRNARDRWKLDARVALRTLAARPWATLAILLLLALGIGATTAVYSIVRGVLLRPLPYPEPDRLVTLLERNESKGFPRFSVAGPVFQEWATRSHTVGRMTYYLTGSGALTGEGEPEVIPVAYVSGEFFEVLNLPPLLGRTLLPDDCRDGQENVAVLSEGFWKLHFGADEAVLGRKIVVDEVPLSIVGIMPDCCRQPSERIVLWTPWPLPEWAQTNRGNHFLQVFGRLEPGIGLADAEQELSAISAGLMERFPEDSPGWGATVESLHASLIGEVDRPLLILFAAVGLVLLIVCANVANLMLVRGMERGGEISIRISLGASRWDVIRQFLIESLMLALAGAAVGVVLAQLGTPAILSLATGMLPGQIPIAVDTGALLFTLMVAVGTGLLFGLLPAIRSVRQFGLDRLRDSLYGNRIIPRSGRLRGALVVAEIALAMLLFTGAGLLLRSFAGLMHSDPGFDARGTLTFRIELPYSRYNQLEPVQTFYDALLTGLPTVPGVTSVAATNTLPLIDGRGVISWREEGETKPFNACATASYRSVTPDYFEVMRIPLLRGRGFTDADTIFGSSVVIVDQAMVDRFWPDTDPLGQRIELPLGNVGVAQVIGVVGAVRQQDLSAPPDPAIYIPFDQLPAPSASYVVRYEGERGNALTGIRERLAEVDPNLPLARILDFEEITRRATASQRFAGILAGIFAAFALLLSMAGIYSVAAYAVSSRRREFGIRIALGADSADIIRGVLGGNAPLILLGIGLGLVGSLFTARLIQSLLFGISPWNAVNYVISVFVVLIVMTAAVLVPAQRASRIDPAASINKGA
jgi:putative ABC transport system permease protein